MCSSMKTRIFILLTAAALAFSCSGKTEVIPAFKAGNPVAVCHVGASGGEVSVLVETKGQWRIRTSDSWISTDVPGGSGRGAFTFSYASNQSDILNLRPGRVGRIAICMEESGRADTLLVDQRGFLTPAAAISVVASPDLKLEFEDPATLDVKLLVASSEGASSASVADWVQSYGAAVSVLDGVVSGSVDGLNVLGCCFEGESRDQEFASFREKVLSSV